MLKTVLNQKLGKILLRYGGSTFFYTVSQGLQKKGPQIPKKAYQILLHSSLQFLPKLPTPSLFRSLKLTGITRIMATNHMLDHQKVLQGHIECLFTIIDRNEVSIEGTALFVDHIFKIVKKLHSKKDQIIIDTQQKLILGLMKPNLMIKLVKLAHSSENYYNQALRQLITMFICKSLQLSQSSSSKRQAEIKNINQVKASVLAAQTETIEINGQILSKSGIDHYVEKKVKQVSLAHPSLTSLDYLKGIQYVLSVGYYNDDFLDGVLARLTVKNYSQTGSLMETILKIRLITSLEKYKNMKKVSENAFIIFKMHYPKLLSKYQQYFLNEKEMFVILQESETIIQSQLILQFLSKEDQQKFKDIYLKFFKNVFDSYANGSINMDVKKIKGVFQIMIALCNYDDTAQVHQILKQFERALVFYPNTHFQKLETHCFLSDKYGYKSDIFADLYLKHLLDLRDKLVKNKRLIHVNHLATRSIHLGRKVLIYLAIADNPKNENFELAQQLASTLFMSSIWHLIPNQTQNQCYFINNPSNGISFYFRKADLTNLTMDKENILTIQKMAAQMKIYNLSPHMDALKAMLSHGSTGLGQTVKFDHNPFWRNNPRARLLSIFELALHQANYIEKKQSRQEAQEFVGLFFNRVMNNRHFYIILKQNIAYPALLQALIKVQQKIAYSTFPVLARDVLAIKNMFDLQLRKIKDESLDRIQFQQNLDTIDTNFFTIPFFSGLYHISGIVPNARQSLLFHASRRFLAEKQSLKMEIETYYKYNKKDQITVLLNFFDFPFFADLKIIKSKDQQIIVFFMLAQNENTQPLKNYKLENILKDSQNYWRKKRFDIVYIRTQEDLKAFFEERIKKDRIVIQQDHKKVDQLNKGVRPERKIFDKSRN